MAWPGEVIEERAGDIAEAADVLLRHQAAWRHRRVETITVLTHEQMRRHVSIDFTVPEAQREGLRISADEFVVPLALLTKRPLVHFDLRNEEQHAIPLLTAEQHRTIARELLYRQLDDEGVEAASELIEAVLADEPQDVEPLIGALEEAHGIELADFRATAIVLSQYFIAWAIVRGLDRRRVFKFAFDEPVGRKSFVYFIGAPGCTEAESYHLEVAVPADLKARRTLLVDGATGRRLAAGERDTDRAALYFRAEPPLPEAPELVIDFAAERWRFLAPAALVASIIALLIAPPFLFSDLTGAARHRRRRRRSRALHVGRVLGPHPAQRRAPAGAADARPRAGAARRQHRRRAVRRRLDRLPHRRLDHRGHVGDRRPCLRADRRYPDRRGDARTTMTSIRMPFTFRRYDLDDLEDFERLRKVATYLPGREAAWPLRGARPRDKQPPPPPNGARPS